MSILIIALCVAVVTSTPVLNEENGNKAKCTKEIKGMYNVVENFLKLDKTEAGQADLLKLQQEGLPEFRILKDEAQNGVMVPNNSPSDPSFCSSEISNKLFHLVRKYGKGSS
ncbi:uncharacterized protein [Venturia canescens]|uniref:uncharacterized protein n=1 Tax=Venturia canescens TaxID=32260 RepID=UPI001C9C5D7B|nr:uncharacterized protein LOC122407623 [Venturia canescens]